MTVSHTVFKIDENGYFRERVYADDTIGKSEQAVTFSI